MEQNNTYISNLKSKDSATSFYNQFQEETKHPYEANLALLLKIINDNKDTEYGKIHSFSSIKTYEDYKKLVPVIEYKDISSYIERMANGEKNILTSYPFTHMNLTSGTIGKQKKIPMTQSMMNSFMSYDKLYGDGMLYKLFGDEWAKGRIFCGAQGKSTQLPSGITVGDASSVLAKSIQGGKEGFNSLMNIFYTSPVEASIPEEGTDSRYLHCLFALMDRNITGILFGYLGIVVNYLDFIYVNHKTLIEDIKLGRLNKNVKIDKNSRKSVESRLKPNKERADELTRIFSSLTDKMYVKKVWPNLLFVRGVGGASFSVYTNTLKKEFIGNDVVYLLSGITSSEGLYSVFVEPNNEDGALALNSVFFEFLPLEANGDFTKIVNIEGLEEGKIYELVITNLSGFYRYRMSDCVKVVGYYNKTPRLRYMYRTMAMINLHAEKTTEAALNAAIKDTNIELNGTLSDYVACANTKDTPAHYDIFLQYNNGPKQFISYKEIEQILEKNLCNKNEEYKVSVGNDFNHLRVLFLPPYTTDLYRDMRIKKGASSMQCKPIHILTTDEQKSFFYSVAINPRKKISRYHLYIAFSMSNKIKKRGKKLAWYVSYLSKKYASKIFKIKAKDIFSNEE